MRAILESAFQSVQGKARKNVFVAGLVIRFMDINRKWGSFGGQRQTHREGITVL